MDVAQLYMLALRPVGAPIVGEAPLDLGPPFAGQVELEGWSWDFHNDDELATGGAAGAATSAGTARESAEEMEQMSRQFSPATLDRLRGDRRRENERLRRVILSGGSSRQVSANDFSNLDRIERRITVMERQQSNLLRQAIRQSRTLAEQVNEAADDAETAAEGSDTAAGAAGADAGGSAAERPDNYKFTFSKRLDVSTTQLLNCMKAGDILPTVTLTMHQSSSNTPWTLVITITKVRLDNYSVSIDTSETMTDTKETWTATYESFGYVYKNRGHAGTESLTAGGATQTAAKAATQGTVRTFIRKNMSFF